MSVETTVPQPLERNRTDYPPAPWRSEGVLWAGVFRADAPLPLPEGIAPLFGHRWAVLMLVRYLKGTLTYDEFIIGSMVRRVLKPALWVHHIWVDDEQSLWGGRMIWGLHKEMAHFDWQDDSTVAITDADGPVATLKVNPTAAGGPTMAISAPGLGYLDGFWAFSKGRFNATFGDGGMSVVEWPDRYGFTPKENPAISVKADPAKIEVLEPRLVPAP